MQPLDVLQRVFGHTEFRGCQAAVIDRVLAGGHALVIMPTGGGKSLCYQIPAFVDSSDETNSDGATPLTLVLSPLIALMKDQVDALNQRGISAAFVNSSLSRAERNGRYERIRAGEFRLLYVTPERFRKRDFLEALAKRDVRRLAVDEAHCISEWGHDFRPDYTRVGEIRQRLGCPTTIALTATATPDVQTDIVRQLGLQPSEIALFHEGIDRPNLRIDVQEVWGDEEKLDAIESVIARHRESGGSGIVYFTLIRTLERFSDFFRERGWSHVCYHGDLDREQRRHIQTDFMDSRCPLVLATPAFGLGIDKEDIRFVIHAEIPGSLEAWYQEIGRAGRDGQPADCLLLYDQRDLTTQMEFIQWSNPDADHYERVFEVLSRDMEQFRAFGLDWLRDRLHIGRKHDRRLETTLAMLERHGVIEGDWEDELPQLAIIGDLPPELRDPIRLAEKHRRDQLKLHALVQLVRCDGDRRQRIQEYFGIQV